MHRIATRIGLILSATLLAAGCMGEDIPSTPDQPPSQEDSIPTQEAFVPTLGTPSLPLT